MIQTFKDIHQQIENRRNIMKASDDEIEVIDYGAGQPHDKRTQEEMQKGFKVQVKLKDLASIGVKEEKAKIIHQLFTSLNPQMILELGTCLGFSSSYMAFFAPKAHIHTIEGSPNTAHIAKENYNFFKLNHIHIHLGRFDLILPDLLPQIKPIDFAFIDGHHDKEATLAYFKQILPFMNTTSVMLFDDISWSEGMKEAWQNICETKAHKKIEDFGNMGALWL